MKKRIEIFITVLAILFAITIGFCVRLGIEHLKYQEYVESLNGDNFYIDGSDFSGITNFGKQLAYSAKAAVGDYLFEAFLFVLSFAGFAAIGFVYIRKNTEDISKKECLIYLFSVVGALALSSVISCFCARFSSIDTVIVYNLTVAVPALLFVVVRAFYIYGKLSKNNTSNQQ